MGGGQRVGNYSRCDLKGKQPVTEQEKLAKTAAERQADLRQRRAEAGLTEVRGVYAKPSDHAKIKAFAKSLQTKSGRASKSD